MHGFRKTTRNFLVEEKKYLEPLRTQTLVLVQEVSESEIFRRLFGDISSSVSPVTFPRHFSRPLLLPETDSKLEELLG